MRRSRLRSGLLSFLILSALTLPQRFITRKSPIDRPDPKRRTFLGNGFGVVMRLCQLVGPDPKRVTRAQHWCGLGHHVSWV